MSGPLAGNPSDPAWSESLPHDLDAERAVLGSALIDRHALTALPFLTPEHFFLPVHQALFAAMRALADAGVPPDLLTVSDELRRRDQLDIVGGLAYLAGLANLVPSSLNAEHYARIVTARAAKRALIEGMAGVLRRAQDEGSGLPELTADLEALLLRLGGQTAGGLLPVRPTVAAQFEAVGERALQGAGLTGLRTGLYDLDRILAGLQPGNLIVVMAPTSTGKSALLATIAHHVAVKEGRPVGIFTLEMTAGEYVDRLLCIEGKIDSHHYKTGQFSDSEWDRLAAAAAVLAEAPIDIDDRAALSISELGRSAKQYAQRGSPALLIVDYLQLLSGGGRSESRVQELGAISKGLMVVARELGVPLIVGAQVNRPGAARGAPRIGDLRESGSGELDAHVVLGLYRKLELDEGDPPEVRNLAQLQVLKNRNGPIGTVRLYFDAPTMHFRPLAP